MPTGTAGLEKELSILSEVLASAGNSSPLPGLGFTPNQRLKAGNNEEGHGGGATPGAGAFSRTVEPPLADLVPDQCGMVVEQVPWGRMK